MTKQAVQSAICAGCGRPAAAGQSLCSLCQVLIMANALSWVTTRVTEAKGHERARA